MTTTNETPDYNTSLHKIVCAELHETYKKKNKDYGDSFSKTYIEYGDVMPLIRIEDKFNRYKNLIMSVEEPHVRDESVEDTLLDLANYAIMTVMEMRKIHTINNDNIDVDALKW